MRSATALARAIRQGEVTSVGLLNVYLERIDRYNGELNAVVTLDGRAALERAQAADAALRKGVIWGPLHGVPMTVKDTLAVAGITTTAGDPGLSRYVPHDNAIAVQRLVDAGAIVFGKTNVPFHGNDWQSFNDVYGTTNNPWDLTRTPGGSSGGASAALAAGLTALELGSDIGGSVRIPASFTGVFGHKPSFGLVPRFGHIPPMPGAFTVETMRHVPYFVVGPLARSADDLQLVLDIVTGADPPPSTTQARTERRRLKDYRVAVWLPRGDMAPSQEITKRLVELAKQLKRAGARVDRHVRLEPVFAEDVTMTYRTRDATGALIYPVPSAIAAHQKKQRAYWSKFFKRYDVLLTPVSPSLAFPHDHSASLPDRTLEVDAARIPYLSNWNFSKSAVLAGLPATVAPLELAESCLPVGVQIMGAFGNDRTTIDFAREISTLVGGFSPPPNYD